MKWAFWRRGGDSERPVVSRSSMRGTPDDADPAHQLRVSARRRLIGAAVLLLAAVIIVPMILDPAPRTVPDSVSIDIPADKTPFAPRLNLPAASGPSSPDALAQQPAALAAPLLASADPAAAGKGVTAGTQQVPDPAPQGDEATRVVQQGTDAPVPQAAVRRSDSGRFALQAAALGTEAAARELAERLKKNGYVSFTEKVSTKDGARWRVRVGPYAARDEADRVRAGLRELGVNANLVIVER
jgi:DedD protein